MPPSEPNRIFISYARSDSSEYAAWLRERLEKEHPEINLWQDIISERGGRKWWPQITEALDNVAYMVLVATPKAMGSEPVQKEWRYARQQGVCVLPVQASDALDLTSLPRWIQTQHFINLKIKEQWNNFVSDLQRPCETPRVPFMAEDLPKDFVARPEEFEPLMALRPACHARMGAVDDLAIAIAKADSASSRIWIRRSSRQSQAERVIGAAAEGAAQQSTRFSCPQWGRRMARNPGHQEDRLIPA
jgi:TIR domain-containing protein